MSTVNGVTTTYGINWYWSTMQQGVERRSESRLPIVVPVEYSRPDDSAILSYALDLSKNGTFISSDDPLSTGSGFGMQLTIPVDDESSKVFRTEATVTWNKIQPFKSKSNGMGVRFVEPLPEDLLLHALAHSYRKLIKETEAKKLLEDRVERLESELEDAERLGALGRYVEKILFEVSNPLSTLSGKLETIKIKMRKHKTMFQGHREANKGESKRITEEFDNCCREVDQILKDYKTISELAHTVGDDRETLERKLKKLYRC